MWLDFTEIPPAIAPSSDTEAFEKFAKQFFEVVFSGVIEKTAGRGADGGADLVVKVGDVKWLVSCKHYLKTSVTASDEWDPRGRLDAHGCTKFVSFYSSSPNNSLNIFLKNIQTNHPSFEFEIFNDKDIEAGLFSESNAKGWLLAARWFPGSYAKLFSQLIHPINHFADHHIQVDESSGRVHAGTSPISVYFQLGNQASETLARKQLLFASNESATSRAFSPIFFNRIAEFAALFPGTFQKLNFIPTEELATNHIYPSWSFQELSKVLLVEGNFSGATDICRVWSFWDQERSFKYLRALQMLHSLTLEERPKNPVSFEEATRQYEVHRGEGSSTNAFNNVHKKFALAEIAISSPTLERGYFAGLLCFSPGYLQPVPDPSRVVVALAEIFEEAEELEKRLWAIVPKLSSDDRRYVETRSPNLLELLRSVELIEAGKPKYMNRITSGLRCFTDNGLEPWIPSAALSNDLAKIFKPSDDESVY